jgi:predicted DNA-binding protein (MmcQ/YjbR family)
MSRPPAAHGKAEATLVAYALTYPDAHEDWPWGERVIKVRGKIFAFLGMVEGTLRLGVKLPVSAEMALTLPYVSPSRYGLGRAGWVTAHLPHDETPDVDLMKGWIDQSYRAVAPKKLVRSLPGSD